ncbi:MAG: UDP-4-amino-4,6-dideoxy-N-acetyl-beta-L-altrosamine transaminase [Clostridium sp.]
MSELAIYGGDPIRDNFLSYGKQYIDDNDIESVVKVLKGDYLTTGPYIEEFENKISQYVGSGYAVSVSNGTAALHIACLSAGIKEGDEVIVSAITFAASSNAVLYCGATPVFADINPKTYNIDIEDIKKKITRKTKAIIAVDFTGMPVDIDSILEICDKHNLIFIEDGAHSLGAEYKGEKVGNRAHMTTFSFHPVKPITTGEGGVVTTNDKLLYEKLKLFRSHGITRDSEISGNNLEKWNYEQVSLGFNYRLTDIQAALGISQLDKINGFIEARRRIAKVYNQELANINEIILPLYDSEDYKSGWHLYIIKIKREALNATREEIFNALVAENIGVNVHYKPVYYHKYYEKIGYNKGICFNSENLYEDIITLPLFPKMSDYDIESVVSAIKKVINYYKK